MKGVNPGALLTATRGRGKKASGKLPGAKGNERESGEDGFRRRHHRFRLLQRAALLARRLRRLVGCAALDQSGQFAPFGPTLLSLCGKRPLSRAKLTKIGVEVVTTVRNAIQFLRRVFGQKPATREQDYAHFFARSGYEYYANARFAMRAQSSYVCGNLFHHAVEMLLKADLAKNGKSLEELERMRHNLKRLWRAYKRDHPNAALSRHDTTINRLDKHEDIRYPNPALGSIGVSMEWSGEPGGVKAYGRMKSPKQYAVVVSDIDDLVADIVRTSSWNPGAIVGNNDAALEAIRRNNKHAQFLTSWAAERN